MIDRTIGSVATLRLPMLLLNACHRVCDGEFVVVGLFVDGDVEGRAQIDLPKT